MWLVGWWVGVVGVVGVLVCYDDIFKNDALINLLTHRDLQGKILKLSCQQNIVAKVFTPKLILSEIRLLG